MNRKKRKNPRRRKKIPTKSPTTTSISLPPTPHPANVNELTSKTPKKPSPQKTNATTKPVQPDSTKIFSPTPTSPLSTLPPCPPMQNAKQRYRPKYNN
jgi:hypothetical protein